MAAERKPSKAAPSLDTPLSSFSGVGAATAQRLARLGVASLRDALYFFPRRYLDYRQVVPIAQLAPGREQTVLGFVWQAKPIMLGGRLKAAEAVIGDDTGNIRALWFNQPYLARSLPSGARVLLSGKVDAFRGQLQMESPAYEVLEGQTPLHAGRLVPLYPLTEGLYPRSLRRLMKRLVDTWAPQVPDPLPAELRERARLLPLAQALAEAHFPTTPEALELGRRRLAFDELFALQLALLARRRVWQAGDPSPVLAPAGDVLQTFLSALPFPLTAAQARVLAEIRADLARPLPMGRLLQGEVGSGKTVVAVAALILAAAAGYQGAFMAPTEILAEQHFGAIARLLDLADSSGWGERPLRRYHRLLGRPFTLALLVGSLKRKEKAELKGAIARGEVDLAVGTHALVQEEVGFERLGLVVVDEQHRFGVMQRATLREKGHRPHLLAMTATPIPRTLALTLYGDLALSVINELPPGRQAIRTRWLEPRQRQSAYAFIRKQVEQGRQAFIICPLIEESEAIEAKAATAEHERLSREVFPDLKLALLHGRLKPAEKEAAMARFRSGEAHILVATPVVEVGIDIPNATVMLVEGADRFGLSQLHQFRGRVGRGQHQSYCMLLSDSPSPEAQARLAALERSGDGFALAEEDLRLRGPGEFFGTRQSGLPDLKMARLTDLPLLEEARREAERLFAADPELAAPPHRLLAREVARLAERGGEAS